MAMGRETCQPCAEAQRVAWDREDALDAQRRLLTAQRGRLVSSGLDPRVLERIDPSWTWSEPAVAAVRAWETTAGLPGSDTPTGLLLFGSKGRGKALRVDEPVLTPSGWAEIGSLCPGDEVIGSAGIPVRVQGVYPQGERDLWRVRTKDGTEILADGDHLWTVDVGKGVKGRRTVTVRTAELLDVAGSVRLPRIAAWDGPTADADLPIDPYALGCLIGDGCLHGVTPSITSDLDLIAALPLPDWVVRGRPFALVGGGTVGTVNLGDEAASWSTPSRLALLLRELGVACKSGEKVIPESYMLASAAARRRLLAGLLDTDGSPCVGQSSIEFSSASRRLSEQVRELALSLGWLSGPVSTSGAGYVGRDGVRVACQDRNRVRVSTFANPFFLKRKADLWMAPQVGHDVRKIASVEPAGRGEAVCISVDAEDSLFIARDFVPTHNTILAARAFHGILKRYPGFWRQTTKLVEDAFSDFDSPERDEARVLAQGRHVVVLDDFCKARTTPTAQANLFDIVDALYARRTPFIITSNLSPEQIAARYNEVGDTIISRLQETAQFVAFQGPDLRAAQALRVLVA